MDRRGRDANRLTSLGPYTLLDRVGAGGMGVVYRALDRRSGSVVAVKLLHEHVALDPAQVDRFRREAHVASLLRSPYTVRTLEFGQHDGRYFIVSDFVDGVSLSELLRTSPPGPAEAFGITIDVALSLDEAESRQVTHRDIKPDNILIGEDGAARVADFGIASLPYLDGLTLHGVYVGTVAYSAPEQHRGRADTRSDIYSLGVVLFEALTHQRPFDAESPVAVMRLHEEAPPPLGLLAGFPPEVHTVIARCMEKAPEDRYQRVADLIAALQAAKSAVAAASGPFMFPSSVATPLAVDQDVTGAVALPTVAAPPPAPTQVAPTEEPAAATLSAPPLPPGAPSNDHTVPRGWKRVLLGVAGGTAIVVALVAVFLGSRDDGDAKESNTSQNGGDATVSAGATTTGGLSSPTAQPTATGTVTATTTPGTTPTAPAVTPTQQGVAPVAPTPTPVPPTPTPVPPSPTPIPPTPTPVPPSFSIAGFSTTLSTSGTPPGDTVAPGGSFGARCRPTVMYAYARHQNAPGTQLTGSWYFEGVFNASNPTFTTDSASGTTYYEFGNAAGLPIGTYRFALRAGLAEVAQGTVRIDC